MSSVRRLLLSLFLWLTFCGLPAFAIIPQSLHRAQPASIHQSISASHPRQPLHDSESNGTAVRSDEVLFADTDPHQTRFVTPPHTAHAETLAYLCWEDCTLGRAGPVAVTPPEILPLILRPGIRAYPSSPRDPPLLALNLS